MNESERLQRVYDSAQNTFREARLTAKRRSRRLQKLQDIASAAFSDLSPSQQEAVLQRVKGERR